jgi:hypothetical protein
MHLAPRGPYDWSELELTGRFLNRRVYFVTLDGQRVEAEVVGIGPWSNSNRRPMPESRG